MKILLIGECYSNNLGDPVLCQTVKYIIEEAYSEAEVIMYDMSGKVGYFSHYDYHSEEYKFGHKLLLKLSAHLPKLFLKSRLYRDYIKNETRYIRALYSLDDILNKHSFDLAVFAGGSLFMDYFAGIIFCIVHKLARHKTKMIFHACGMSSLNQDSIDLLRIALNNKYVCSISLRDSFERFRQLFHRKANVIETNDTALNCSKYFCSANRKRADIGIGLMKSSAYIEYQKSLLDYLRQSSLPWKVFTNGADQKDAIETLCEIGMTEEEIDRYLEPCPKSAEEMVELITSFGKIVSFRMHGNIIAASYGIPCFGFVWDDKVKEFFTKLGFDRNYVTMNEVFDIDAVCERLDMDVQRLRKEAKRQGIDSKNELIRAMKYALDLGSERSL